MVVEFRVIVLEEEISFYDCSKVLVSNFRCVREMTHSVFLLSNFIIAAMNV